MLTLAVDCQTEYYINMEKYNSPEEPIDFDKLDDVFDDPYIKETYAKVRSAEAKLNNGENHSNEVFIQTINNLDENWRHMKGQIIITGEITPYAGPNTLKSEDLYVEDEPFMSQGFTIQKQPIVDDNGEFIADSYRVVQQVAHLNPDGTATPALVDHDKVLIKYPDSPELRINRLDFYAPETTADIDVLLLNCEAEEDMVAALKDFRIAQDDVESYDSYLKDANVYINRLIDFDKKLPYIVMWRGAHYEAIDHDSLGVTKNTEQVRALVQPTEIRFLPYNLLNQIHGERNIHSAYLAAQVYSDNSQEDTHEIMIPVENIDGFASLRRSFNAGDTGSL